MPRWGNIPIPSRLLGQGVTEAVLLGQGVTDMLLGQGVTDMLLGQGVTDMLLGQGVTDMLRITDGRMSGTGFGTVVLHVVPESAVGGPLSKLRDGDMVSLDAYAGSLSVEADLASRDRGARGQRPAGLAGATPDARPAGTGGCDYDFLRPETPEQLAFIEPVIGRS